MCIRVSVQRNYLFCKTNTQKTVAKVNNLRTEEKASFVYFCIRVSGQRNHSLRVSLKIMPSLQFRKRTPNTASAVDAKTKCKIAHKVKNTPFNLMGSPSFGDHHMKKWPHARLLALDSDNYDSSKWTFIIMSEAQK